ncbi:MAG: hypothetical protein EOO68_24835 [Moraxellaceae bacterium]|nr:MAG: hypothetical protein EOO68_24835 [Moraxellaceae bacterium]
MSVVKSIFIQDVIVLHLIIIIGLWHHPEGKMKSIGIVGLLSLLLAQPAFAGLLNLEMSGFSSPPWNEGVQSFSGNGLGSKLNLIIDDQVKDQNPSADGAHFINAIKGATFVDSHRNISFVLKPLATTHISANDWGFISMGFGGVMLDAEGREASFSLYLEGNLPTTACESLVDLQLDTKTWFDSVFFELRGPTIDIVFAAPAEIKVGQVTSVPEPAPIFTMLVGLMGILIARKKFSHQE